MPPSTLLSLNPATTRRLVRVSKPSAPPWSQSTLARVSPYWILDTIPEGIVARTKRRRYWKPKFPRFGVLLGAYWRKYRKKM